MKFNNQVNKIARNPLEAKEENIISLQKTGFETDIIQNSIVKIGTLLACKSQNISNS